LRGKADDISVLDIDLFIANQAKVGNTIEAGMTDRPTHGSCDSSLCRDLIRSDR